MTARQITSQNLPKLWQKTFGSAEVSLEALKTPEKVDVRLEGDSIVLKTSRGKDRKASEIAFKLGDVVNERAGVLSTRNVATPSSLSTLAFNYLNALLSGGGRHIAVRPATEGKNAAIINW